MTNQIRLRSRSTNVDIYTFKMGMWWLTVVSCDSPKAVPPSIYRNVEYKDAVQQHKNSCAFAQGYYSHVF
jgi:hypothetical protein